MSLPVGPVHAQAYSGSRANFSLPPHTKVACLVVLCSFSLLGVAANSYTETQVACRALLFIYIQHGVYANFAPFQPLALLILIAENTCIAILMS